MRLRMNLGFQLGEDLRSPDDDEAIRVFDSFFSHGKSDL
jgi:hypothetical protein